MSEANRLGSRLHPQRLGAALNQRSLLCFVEDLDFVAAKVNRFGFVAMSCNGNGHRIAGLFGTPLRNHETSLPSKLNQACVDGEPYNAAGPSFAAGGIRSHDELTEGKCFLFVIGFHHMSLEQATVRALWGVYPIRDCCEATHKLGVAASWRCILPPEPIPQ